MIKLGLSINETIKPEIILVSPPQKTRTNMDSLDLLNCAPDFCTPYCRVQTCQPECGIRIQPTCRPVGGGPNII